MVIDVEPIRERFTTLASFLDERCRRLLAATEAFAAGYGGIAAVALATGMAPSTIGRGLKQLAQDEPTQRIRRPGAGRKPGCSLSIFVRHGARRETPALRRSSGISVCCPAPLLPIGAQRPPKLLFYSMSYINRKDDRRQVCVM